MDPTESAIVLAVLAAETLVSQWRRLYDPAATWGVPAHVTVLYPFVTPDALDESVLARIQQIAAGTPRFDEIEADVAPSLPLAAAVDALCLTTGSLAADSWRTVKTFPLG